MAWQPDQQQLGQLSEFLRDSLSARDQNARRHADLMLARAKSSPDITNYFAYILTNLQPSTSLSDSDCLTVRAAAASSLKNQIRSNYRKLSPQNIEYAKSATLSVLKDGNSSMRGYAGNVITELVTAGGIQAWPEIIPQLLSIAANDGGNETLQTQEGAMATLGKIFEDNTKALEREYQGSRPLNVIIPKLYQIANSQSAKVRSGVLQGLNLFIPRKPEALVSTIETCMQLLFSLAHDSDPEVRRFVCRAFTALLDVQPEKIVPHMDGLVEYIMQQQTTSDDDGLVLDAAEFWLSIAENEDLCKYLEPYLNRILPTMLVCMVYSEENVARLEGDADDADVEDREEDIKPAFATSKRALAGDAAKKSGDQLPAVNDDLEEGELEEDDLDEEADDDPEAEWNLRKCSAATLDALALQFHQPVFDISLPYLRENLTHAEWPRREAAVLAIGAVADGCMEAIHPHLPELIPFLISSLQDHEAVVRKITCWALGRYASWAAFLPPEQQRQFFEPMMDGILQKMLDHNKSVQEAAASAFSNLEEAARAQIIPYCKVIMQQFVKCFAVYKDRNMFILYDCVQTLAEHIGPQLAQPDLMSILMPSLLERWTKVSDQSQELFPLLECMTYVVSALGDAFSPYVLPMFERCIRILHQNLAQYVTSLSNDAILGPNKDFLITSLDLLSAIIQSLPGQKSGELVNNSQPKMFDLLQFCLEDPNDDVRQSAYALLGDCAIHIYPQLAPRLPNIWPLIVRQLDIEDRPDEETDETTFNVLNNACWSAGEIAMRQQRETAPYIPQLLERLKALLFNNDVPAGLSDSAALTFGRLGVSCSGEIAPQLSDFAPRFVQIMRGIEDTDEKRHAFLGFNRVIMMNPTAMESSLEDYFKSAAKPFATKCKDAQVKESFAQVLNGFKSLLPNFEGFMARLSEKEQTNLRTSFGL